MNIANALNTKTILFLLASSLIPPSFGQAPAASPVAPPSPRFGQALEGGSSGGVKGFGGGAVSAKDPTAELGGVTPPGALAAPTRGLGSGVFGGGGGIGSASENEPFGMSGYAEGGSINAVVRAPGREMIPPILVDFASPDPAKAQQLEEDLSVMTHILSQALERGLGEETPQSKMGVRLLYTGSGRSVRALYLGGFGALFMIKVNVPLLAIPEPSEEKAAVKAPDSEWESARREVLGLDSKEEPFWTSTTSSDLPFDFDQVDGLKKTILIALKNASNIRGLRPDDFLSVAVFGHPAGTVAKVSYHVDDEFGQKRQAEHELKAANSERTPETAPAAGNVLPSVRSKSSHRSSVSRTLHASSTSSNLGLTSALQKGTVLTMRVRKSDVDAFAEGKLNLDDFTKKVTMAAYGGSGYGVTSLNSWVKRSGNFLPSVRY
jgi:hypothetical protein